MARTKWAARRSKQKKPDKSHSHDTNVSMKGVEPNDVDHVADGAGATEDQGSDNEPHDGQPQATRPNAAAPVHTGDTGRKRKSTGKQKRLESEESRKSQRDERRRVFEENEIKRLEQKKQGKGSLPQRQAIRLHQMQARREAAATGTVSEQAELDEIRLRQQQNKSRLKNLNKMVSQEQILTGPQYDELNTLRARVAEQKKKERDDFLRAQEESNRKAIAASMPDSMVRAIPSLRDQRVLVAIEVIEMNDWPTVEKQGSESALQGQQQPEDATWTGSPDNATAQPNLTLAVDKTLSRDHLPDTSRFSAPSLYPEACNGNTTVLPRGSVAGDIQGPAVWPSVGFYCTVDCEDCSKDNVDEKTLRLQREREEVRDTQHLNSSSAMDIDQDEAKAENILQNLDEEWSEASGVEGGVH